MSEYERKMIALRLRAGRQAKLKRDGYAGGPVPFGFTVEDGKLVERKSDEPDQRALGRMRELRSEGASTRRIAAALLAEGFRPPRAESWHPRTVLRLLERG